MTNTNNTNELKKYEITYTYVNDEDGFTDEEDACIAEVYGRDETDAEHIFSDSQDMGNYGYITSIEEVETSTDEVA